MPIPFTRAWKQARLQKAEQQWEVAMAAVRAQSSEAELLLQAAIAAGPVLNFFKANQLLWPPQPQAMEAFLQAAPALHPNAGWSARSNHARDTLLHFWAQAPEPVETTTPGIEAMNDLLWHPPGSDDEDNQWPTSQLSPYLKANNVDWWGNRKGLTPRMLAASHGHWPLLERLAWPLAGVAAERAVVEEDKQGEHWVDHWVTGLLSRGIGETISAVAVQAARRSEDFPSLLLKSNSPQGTPAARLWAHGVTIATLLEWIADGAAHPHQALSQSLHPSALVFLSDGTQVALALQAPRIHPLKELSTWANLYPAHKHPFISPLPKRTAERPPSLAAAWAGPLLLEGMKHHWFAEGNFTLAEQPGFEQRLHQALQANESWLPDFLTALEHRYPRTFGDPRGPYTPWKKALELEANLPAATTASSRKRF